MDDLTGFVSYDDMAVEPLKEYGWAVEYISWRDRNADWSNLDAVIVRTTWDYHRSPAEFIAALENIAGRTHLENSVSLIKWNLDKRYLTSLAEAGVAVVRTEFFDETLDAADLDRVRSEFGCEELIIKPTVSASSANTFRTTSLTPEIAASLAGKHWMVQPFLESVLTDGEYSLFYFGGAFSHAIRKIPASGDFRVQEEHGGTITQFEPDSEMTAAAERTMAVLPETPLYARVDLIRGSSGLELMELELIEPSLYFQYADASAERFAKCFADRMNEI